MEQEQANRRWSRSAYLAMLINGLCASSGSVVLAILRERYGLSYDFAGLLLALISVGNMAAGFLSGVLPGIVGMRTSALLLVGGAAVGYGLLCLTGWPAALLLAFTLVGITKGCATNNSTVLISRAAPGKADTMNLLHACFATSSLLCPFFIALFSRPGLPWYAPMAALAAAGATLWLVFAQARLPAKPHGQKAEKSDWSFLRSKLFWLVTCMMFFQNCSEITFTGWVVTYFQDSGILTGALGNITVTVIWGSMLVMRLLICFVLHIKDNFKALALMAGASMAAYGLLLQAKTGPAALGALVLFGLAIAGTSPTGISSAGRLLSNASVGVLLPVASLGAILMPYIVGAVAQRAGIVWGMSCILVSLACMLVFALICRRELHKQQARVAQNAG